MTQPAQCKLQEIMSQVQVFASAWALVGGRFDGGNAMDEAEVAKNELHQMVAEALAAQPQQEPVAKITGVDEYGLTLGWYKHWINFPVGTQFYTFPPAQRKPLTGLEMTDGCRSLGVGAYRTLAAAFEAGVRFAEAAHGVKEGA